MELEQYIGKDLGFNSRSREGATQVDLQKVATIDVSIHAPVKERPNAYQTLEQRRVSIHAPVKERLEELYTHSQGSSVSIHAPVKERLFRYIKSEKWRCFNSRSREGATADSITLY